MENLNTDRFQCIYFLGIGGIGMSALAQYFLQHGKEVHGYDLTPTAITEELLNKGAHIHFEENISLIPTDVDLVVHTPAVSKEHLEYQFFIAYNVPIFKRSEILGKVSSQYPNIAVAGTHGKTTTTAMITHIFHEEKKLMAFIGGVAKNFNSNFVLDPQVEMVIEEADEFDRSFLQLSPDSAVITSMDADHLDIYGVKEELENSFRKFSTRIRAHGPLIIHENLKGKINYKNQFSYGLEPTADYSISKVQLFPNKAFFNITYQQKLSFLVELGVSGMHNILNATAAFAVAHQWGISPDIIIEKLKTFTGVKRRFDYLIEREDFIFIDDYAHHPEEIRAFFNSVKSIYPEKHITAVFQPHLYSRTRDFALQFAEVLALPDTIILMDIYPAREKPIEGITSAYLLSLIQHPDKKLLDRKQLIDYLLQEKPEVLLTLGAGDIDKSLPELKRVLS